MIGNRSRSAEAREGARRRFQRKIMVAMARGDRKMQRGDGLNRDYGHSPATRDEELKDQMCR